VTPGNDKCGDERPEGAEGMPAGGQGEVGDAETIEHKRQNENPFHRVGKQRIGHNWMPYSGCRKTCAHRSRPLSLKVD
jgi:hypothetical protein